MAAFFISENNYKYYFGMFKFNSSLMFLISFFSVSFSQQIYQNDKYHFRLTFPDEWKIIIDSGASVAINDGKDMELNIVINEKEFYDKNSIDENGLEEFINTITAQLENTCKDYKTINYGKMVIDNINAYYLYYSFGEKKKRLKGSEYFFINKGKFYTITAGCYENDYVNYGPLFKDCVNSFRFY